MWMGWAEVSGLVGWGVHVGKLPVVTAARAIRFYMVRYFFGGLRACDYIFATWNILLRFRRSLGKVLGKLMQKLLQK